MNISAKMLEAHAYTVGASGTGKTSMMQAWTLDLQKQGHGVGYISPASESYHDLLAHLAMMDKRGWNRVILIDPTDPTSTVTFNPLQIFPGDLPERNARFLTSILLKLFHADENITVRMQDIMLHLFWLLSISGLTLVESKLVLTDRQLREKLLSHLPDSDELKSYWMREFPGPKDERTAREWSQAVTNKLSPLMTDPVLRAMFGTAKSSIDFRAAMDERKIILINLAKDCIGEAPSKLLGALLVAQIQLAALSRGDSPYSSPEQFILFLDEFQTYTTDDIQQILAESRKYGLSLVLAHQFYDQLRDNLELQKAVVNTVKNLIVFQVGATDAAVLAPEVFTPPLDEVKDIHYRKQPTGIQIWPYTTSEEAVWRALPEIWQSRVYMLKNLPKRVFWFKHKGPYKAAKFRTPDFPRIVPSPRLLQKIQELRSLSMSTYGHTRQTIFFEIEKRRLQLEEMKSQSEEPKPNDQHPKQADKKGKNTASQDDENTVPPVDVS